MMNHALLPERLHVIKQTAIQHCFQIKFLVYAMHVAEVSIAETGCIKLLFKRPLYFIKVTAESVRVIGIHRAEMHLGKNRIASAFYRAPEFAEHTGRTAAQVKEIHPVLKPIRNGFVCFIFFYITKPDYDKALRFRSVRKSPVFHHILPPLLLTTIKHSTLSSLQVKRSGEVSYELFWIDDPSNFPSRYT